MYTDIDGSHSREAIDQHEGLHRVGMVWHNATTHRCTGDKCNLDALRHDDGEAADVDTPVDSRGSWQMVEGTIRKQKRKPKQRQKQFQKMKDKEGMAITEQKKAQLTCAAIEKSTLHFGVEMSNLHVFQTSLVSMEIALWCWGS